MGERDDAVIVPDAVVREILAHCRQAAPAEACGLLVGRGRHITRAVPTENADASPTRFAIPPDAHFAALRAARREGLEVIGAFHSHPHSPAVPSATDRDAAFPDFLVLIATLVAPPAVRAWSLVDGNFTEVVLVRTEGAARPPAEPPQGVS